MIALFPANLRHLARDFRRKRRNQSAYDAMSPGWGKVLDGVGRVIAES